MYIIYDDETDEYLEIFKYKKNNIIRETWTSFGFQVFSVQTYTGYVANSCFKTSNLDEAKHIVRLLEKKYTERGDYCNFKIYELSNPKILIFYENFKIV